MKYTRNIRKEVVNEIEYDYSYAIDEFFQYCLDNECDSDLEAFMDFLDGVLTPWECSDMFNTNFVITCDKELWHFVRVYEKEMIRKFKENM